MISRTLTAWALVASAVPVAMLLAAPPAAPITVTIDTPMAAPRGRRSSGGCSPRTCRPAASSSRSTSTSAATCSASCAGARTTARTMRSRTSTAGPSCTRWARRRDPAALPEGPRRDDPPVHRGQDHATCRSAATACTTRSSSSQSDWMHHGEGLQLFNRMGLSVPADAGVSGAGAALRRLLHGRGSRGAELRPGRKIIRSMMNGSRGPMLRKATSLDWVGDPFDVTGFVALHGESTYEQFLAHYQEYTDVVGDHFLNLVATTLPTNAYLLTGEPKYRRWIVDYMDAWLERMKQNGGIIPSFVDLDGKSRRAGRALVGQRLRLGVQPGQSGDRPARGSQPHPAGAGRLQQRAARHRRSEIRRRLARDDRRGQRARAGGRTGGTEYPTMHGADGWYGWRPDALERRRAGGVVLVDEAGGSGARRRRRRGSSSSRAGTPAIPRRR